MCFSIIMRYLSCNNTKDVSHYIISSTFWLLLWAAWPVEVFLFTFIAFVPLLLWNELQKRKSVFAHTFLAFLLWNILTTFWIVHATWFGVMMAVLINSLLMASAFTLFSWIKSRLGIKRGGGLLFACGLHSSTFILIGICLGRGLL